MFEYRSEEIKTASCNVSKRIYAKWFISLSLYCIVTFWLLLFTVFIQNGPYMDEIFHVSQLKSYCQGKFDKWNSKITTPPGLYLFTVALTWPLSILTSNTELCWSIPWIRGAVIISGAITPIIVVSILRLLHGVKDEKEATTYITLAISTAIFPVLYFFNFLFYTDVLSTMLVLCTFWLYLKERYTTSAFVGLLSLLLRQTNIMWVAFCAVLTLFRTLRQTTKREFSYKIVTSTKYFQLLWTHSLRHSLKSSSLFFKLTIMLFQNVWAYALVGVLFIIFIVVNGGIVLGDKAAHEAVLHFPQVLYFCAFTLFFTAPLMLSKIPDFFASLRHRCSCALILSILALSMIHGYTMAHPYLLADNRHYTFYIWKNIINRSWWTRYALIPIYVVGALWIQDLLIDTDIAFQITWVTCTLICLVPQRLLEFRYFIIPFLLLRLQYRRATKWEIFLEMLLYTVVNAATIYLYATKKIRWYDMVGDQRIIW